ncbi:MAG: hypothetical protein QG597_4459 [Actinomycetota bacterium]|jgi:glutaredoxin|nr:hypothetical protein [Actinomycetota bacterium]
MKVELLVIDGCPHAKAAAELIATALERSGRPQATVTTTLVTEDNVAQVAGFRGSPTFLIDGVDAFPASAASISVSCRVYQTSDGMRGLPELGDLVDRVRAAS